MGGRFFTSESVTRGHPDKVCDQIADRILDELLTQDEASRVACEVTCAPDQIHIFGEIGTRARVNYEEIARQVVEEIGYTMPGRGFDAETVQVRTDLHGQSPDIALGIDRRREAERLDSGAGDQGTVFGFACRQTGSLMPLPIELAHALAKRLEYVRKTGELQYLLPDGKTQVTVEYRDGAPRRIAAVVVSAQHDAGVGVEEVRRDIRRHVVIPALPAGLMDRDTQIFINPTGRFVPGGPAADAGLTGRKQISDTYGGYARHGGGALSGKDATKTDRSGAYMARYIAKNIVAQGLAETCETSLSYAIGLADPLAVQIDTFGTSGVPEETLRAAVLRCVDLRPEAIIRRFGLRAPIFSQVSCYGHFGSNAGALPWEQTNLPPLL